MGQIFEDQDYLRIELTYTETITETPKEVKIVYLKPTGEEGEWKDNIYHDTEGKKITYTLPAGTYLTPAGTWKFRAIMTFQDDRKLPSEPVEITTYSKWNKA